MVAETLAEKHFDLAFQVIYQFNLPGNSIMLHACLFCETNLYGLPLLIYCINVTEVLLFYVDNSCSG